MKESKRVLMASQMAMRNMSPCEGVKPARGPDEACLRSPGGLNPVFELATIAGEPAIMRACVRATRRRGLPPERTKVWVGGEERGKRQGVWHPRP